MASHPGWSYYQNNGGKASLAAGVTGKGFCADFGGGYSPVYLTYSFPATDTLYIAFSLEFGSIDTMLSRLELLRLTSAGQTDVGVQLVETRQINLTTNMTESPIAHYPGAYWWPEKWTRIVLGVKKGPQGYVRVWADRACIYTNFFNTGSKLIDGLTIGLVNGWNGERVTGKIMLDDVSVGASFADVASEPARAITVNTRILSIVNPDCFGANLGWYGWGWHADYPKVKALIKQVGIGSGRAFLQPDRNWDYHWPYFMYKPTAGDPPGATMEGHLYAMSYVPDPLMSCVLNITGEKGSDWRPQKSAELIGFNQLYNRPDGLTGVRAIYELGNEPTVYSAVTEGWYYQVGSNAYAEIGNGKTAYVTVFDPANPEYLSNPSPAYNYRLDFTPGDYLYIGQRWRFRSLAYALANAGGVSGDKTLRWEYWNGVEWIRFGDVPSCPFVTGQFTSLQNLKSSSDWNSIRWDDTLMQDWTRVSMAGISGDSALSDQALYWIRISHESGGYTGELPVESFVYVSLSGSGYLEAMQVFYPVIADAGAELYAAPGNEGAMFDIVDTLEQNQSLFDGIAWHSYMDPPISTAMRPGEIYAPSTSMLWSVDCLTDRAAEFRQRFPGKKIALTEWNASGVPTTPIQTLAGGLHTALGLCQIVCSGWDAATYYALFCNFYQPHALVTHDVNSPRLRPSGWAFQGIKEHSKRYVLDTTSTYRGIYACAFGGSSPSDGALVVVNRTDKAESVRVTLPRVWSRKVAIYEMAAASLNVDNEKASNVTLKKKSTIQLVSSMVITYKFPPYSLTIFDTKL